MNGENFDPNVKELLAATDPADVGGDAARAWSRFEARRRDAPARAHAWHLRPSWLVFGTAVALVAALGFSPRVRTATAQVLSLFRVSQVAALPFTPLPNAPLADRTTAGMIAQMLADSATVTLNEAPQTASSADQASQLAGFSLRYAPSWGSAAPAFRVQGGKDFHLVLDRARAQSILDDAGVAGVELAPNLDGAAISVHLPRGVVVMYGDCAAFAAATADGHPSSNPPVGPNCTVLGERPSPVVSLPPGLDMQQIATVGLQLLGMSPQEAQQYTSTIDWTSTLVVPFPRGQATSQQVSVDGVQGILLTRSRAGEGLHYVLLWSRQGMLYFVTGAGDGTQGLTLASEFGR